jgi:hypothetical protein
MVIGSKHLLLRGPLSFRPKFSHCGFAEGMIEKDKVFVLPIVLTQTYSTEDEAQRAGLSVAKKWIDDGKPALEP